MVCRPKIGVLFYPEKLYSREYTSGNLRKKSWSQGHCVQSALNTSFASTLQLPIRRQLGVCFDSQSQLLNLADKPDVYSML